VALPVKLQVALQHHNLTLQLAASREQYDKSFVTLVCVFSRQANSSTCPLRQLSDARMNRIGQALALGARQLRSSCVLSNATQILVWNHFVYLFLIELNGCLLFEMQFNRMEGRNICVNVGMR
jgi:hypothetical protein